MRNPLSLFSWHVLHGRLRRDIAYLDSLYYEPYETIRERKMASLRQLVRHAIDNVPFYRELYLKAGVEPGDLKTFEDLKRLPCVKKEDFRKAPMQERLAGNVSPRRRKPDSTSGSTGEPFAFYVDRGGSALETAAHNLSYIRAGWRPGERTASVKSSYGFLMSGHWRQRARQVLGMGAIRFLIERLDPAQVQKAMDRMIACRVILVEGYASSLCTLARQWKNRRPTSIRSVISIAETLLDSDARLVSETFGAEVFRDYGLTECMRVGFECNRHEGYHVDPLRCIVETAKGGGGQEEIVITDLTNWVHPFIRYRVGDVGQMTFDACPCGRRTPRLVNLAGRVLDVIRTPKGKELNSLVLGSSFGSLDKEVDLWQVRQVSETKVDVLVEATDRFNDDTAARLRAEMEALSDGALEFRVRRVDRIPLGRHGKRDRVLSIQRLAAMEREP